MPRAFDLELERRWRERLQEFQRSQLSVREFCRDEGVKEHTFFWWRRELARRQRVRNSAPSTRVRTPKRGTNRRASKTKRTVDAECMPSDSLGRSAFVPVQLIAEPLGASCFEIRLGPWLLRLPTAIDEQALRLAIRLVREEFAQC